MQGYDISKNICIPRKIELSELLSVDLWYNYFENEWVIRIQKNSETTKETTCCQHFHSVHPRNTNDYTKPWQNNLIKENNHA